MNDYVIETKNLTKQYGPKASVSGLNIHVKKGRIYGLLGRNGAGKTTTMKMLLGLTAPTSGEVKIFGKQLKDNEKEILPHIGSLIESPGFYPNLTATENLRIFATLRCLKNTNHLKGALELVGLPYRDKKLYSQYSLGMKQRLAIETGIFITAGTLPLIVLVVFFSKTYVFSILLCVFYSVLNMSATALFDALPRLFLWLMPTPLTTFWSAGDMAAHGIQLNLQQMSELIPSTLQVVLILGVMAILSIILIDLLYKRRGK